MYSNRQYVDLIITSNKENISVNTTSVGIVLDFLIYYLLFKERLVLISIPSGHFYKKCLFITLTRYSKSHIQNFVILTQMDGQNLVLLFDQNTLLVITLKLQQASRDISQRGASEGSSKTGFVNDVIECKSNIGIKKLSPI